MGASSQDAVKEVERHACPGAQQSNDGGQGREKVAWSPQPKIAENATLGIALLDQLVEGIGDLGHIALRLAVGRDAAIALHGIGARVVTG